MRAESTNSYPPAASRRGGFPWQMGETSRLDCKRGGLSAVGGHSLREDVRLGRPAASRPRDHVVNRQLARLKPLTAILTPETIAEQDRAAAELR